MNKLIITIACVIISVSIFGQKSKTDDDNLKVISYNIWNGFDWGKDLARKKELIKFITEQEADVVALQELCGFNEDKLANLARQWGHNYSEILKTDGYPVGITSTKPIEVKERIIENMHHGALHCQTWGIDFMLVHFSPFSYKKRHEEAKIILSKLTQVRKEQTKYLVLGDFNAVSPFDAHLYKANDAMIESLREAEKQHEHVRNLLNNELEFGAISSYLSFPLVDVVQKYTSSLDERISCPTQVFEKLKGKGRHVNSKRIDYILASPELAKVCTDAYVENKEETYYLSDHYPVVAKFEF